MEKRQRKKPRMAMPDYRFTKVTDITAEDLAMMGAKAVAIDLDNTTVKDSSMHLSSKVRAWIEQIQASGFPVIIVTNTFTFRAKKISEKMGGVPFVAFAHKPHTSALRKAAKSLDIELSSLAMIGDQLFTDVVAANKAGAISIRVEPIAKEKFLAAHWKKVRRRESAYLRGEPDEIDNQIK